MLWDKEMWKEKSEFLPDEMLNEMWKPAKLTNGTEVAEYGMGWERGIDDDGHLWVFHGGEIQGFRSSIVRYLANKLTVVLLTNGELEFGTVT